MHLSDTQMRDLRDAFHFHNKRGCAYSLEGLLLPLRFVGCTATLDAVKTSCTGYPIDFQRFLDIYCLLSTKTDGGQIPSVDAVSKQLQKLIGRSPSDTDWIRILSCYGERQEPTKGGTSYSSSPHS
ncbi:hypothetical protein CRM22_004614 [Opisthorchis felineus]|uniref:Uncharacterized protein n=1 Tax=Opisthorchis felineus TaxID=147828 RepID=A0A4S2LV93_OPIFE|nr:hypothetical protein CRM22_004614 [Opisthorchis felineus]